MTLPIVFNEIYRHFDKQDVLRGLSFQVKPGEIFAFLGRNGSGKTTALRILLGLLAPMRGESFILGLDSQALEPADRDRIGYISEGHKLYSTMKVQDALRFEAGTRPRFRRAFAEHAIQRCGLPAKKMIGLLSRGQRAQLALVFAVAGDPEILIFDDPAMGLDVVMRREFLDVMIDLLSDQGCSVLFSSHILTDVERIADRVGMLHNGRLIVDASMEDLKQRVRKVRWADPKDAQKQPPQVDGLLRARPRKHGFDLTLLDLDGDKEKALLNGGAQIQPPVTPTLEELFLDLTIDADAQNIFNPEKELS